MAGSFEGFVGSSPLARGLPARPGVPEKPGGIIPARAGFTRRRSYRESIAWDHPCSRGVYRVCYSPMHSQTGSSPLARGLRTGRPRARTCTRIIPARAGFTHYNLFFTIIYRDHPRSRGVYAQNTIRSIGYGGSSPLARGLRGPARSQAPRARIIPARAGFTQHSP